MTITRGIDTPVRWSPDGERIAFVVSDLTEGRLRQEFYLGNVETASSQVILSQVSGARQPPEWSPDGSRLVIIGNDIQIVDTKSLNVESIPVPPELPAEFKMASVSWNTTGNSILVTGYDSSTVPDTDAVISLWQVDTTSRNWEKLTELGTLGVDDPIRPILGKAWAVVCGTKSAPTDALRTLDPSTWQMVGKIKGSSAHCTAIDWLEDGSGSDVIGFVGAESNGRDIWMAKTGQGDQVAQKMVDGDELGFPMDFQVVYFSSRP